MAQEGQVAIGPNGERAVFRGGQWVVVPNAPPADPKFQYEGPKAAADVQKTQADVRRTQTQAAVESGTAPTTIQTNQAPEGYMWVDPTNPSAGVVRIPGYTPKSAEVKPVEPMKLAQFKALEDQIARVEELYKAGPGSTKGVLGIQDYLPSDANAAFDSAAAGLGEVGLAAFRVPGVGSQSDTELRQFVAANTPSAGDRDAAIQEKLGNLKRRLAATKEQLATTAPKAAGVGATEASVPLPEGFQGGYEALLARLKDGTLTPEQYAAFRVQQDRDAFGDVAKDQQYKYLEEGYQLQQLFEQGADPRNVPPVPPANRELSQQEQVDNNFAASPLGTGLINYADAVGFGGVSALAPDQMNVANQLNPKMALLGQVGGAITGTAGLGKFGRSAVSAASDAFTSPTTLRIAEALLNKGGKSQLARNVGTDALYSTIYGTNTGMDTGDAALSGTIGSVLGNTAGKVIGKTIGGANVEPAVDYLKSRNIPLTAGQTLGGFAKSTEDAMTSVPFIGDMVNARRLEGFQAFNREALSDAGGSIGFTPTRIGREGVTDLVGDPANNITGATGRAYTDAVSGRSFQADEPFNLDYEAAIEAAKNLPADLRENALLAFRNRVDPQGPLSGQISGPQYQGIRSDLKGYRAAETGPGFPQDYRGVITRGIDALDNLVKRQGGEEVVQGLGRADQAYRLGKTVESAASRADGNNYIFTPSQLQDAVKATGRKFPGQNPLLDLADMGQQVLPSKLADSGTGRRVAQMAIPGFVGGGAAVGGAYGAYGDGGLEGAQSGAAGGAGTSLALATALALLGTKNGQKFLTAAIAERPELLKKGGNWITARRGVFGSGAVPVALNSSRQ